MRCEIKSKSEVITGGFCDNWESFVEFKKVNKHLIGLSIVGIVLLQQNNIYSVSTGQNIAFKLSNGSYILGIDGEYGDNILEVR